MTDKKDGPGQTDGPAKAGDRGATDAAAGKRPFATIDLKAVEVPADVSKSGATAASSGGGSKPADTSSKTPQAAPPRPQQEAAEKVAGAAAAQRASAPKPGASATTASAASAAEGKAASSKDSPAPKAHSGAAASATSTSASPPAFVPAAALPPRGSGLGRFVSHTLAGVVGGVLALAAGPYLAPQVTPALKSLGLPPAPPPPVAPDVAQRLAALERTLSTPAAIDPARDPARAVAAAEANRQRLDALAGTVGGLGEAQARTAKTAAELEARIAKDPPIPETGERLVKLEQQLATLAEMARTEPDRAGRIPQLAQLTGRIGEIEQTVGQRLNDLRKDVSRDLEARTGPALELGEAARAAAQRLEREVGTVKEDANRIANGMDQLKTTTERLQLALKSAQDDSARLGASLDGVRRDLEGRLNATAKPADVSAALAPLATQLTTLERNLTSVVKSEGERNATAERIVLSLELGNLKRAMERGQPYTRELAEVRKLGGGRLDLAPLERYSERGVPTVPQLMQSFRPVANAILDAEIEKGDGSVVDRLMSGAKTFVRVRKTTHAAGDASPEAVVARIEAALKAGRLGDVLAEAKVLSDRPAAATDWFAQVEARQIVEAALAGIDATLKASLGATPAASATPSAPPAAGVKKGQP